MRWQIQAAFTKQQYEKRNRTFCDSRLHLIHWTCDQHVSETT